MAFVIGIAGGTGSGKTTIARKIGESLPRDHIALIEHDWYYRDLSNVSPEERAKQNFDHPDSLETSLLVEHVRALKAGKAVEAPQYDFMSHARKKETVHIPAKPVIIVEGILVFVDEALRKEMSIKIFVDTDADIRIMRRVRRDIEQRGRSFASIRDQYYKTVRPMHLAFVEPSKRWADILIPEGGDNHVALDLVTTKLREVINTALRTAS